MSRRAHLLGSLAAYAAFLLLLSPSLVSAQDASSNPNAGVEALVDQYFAATPIMIAIAKCESRFREFNATGAPLDGGSGGMVGVYQVNSRVHKKIALSMGMDIDTTIGNLEYANYLYQQEGTVPWVSSQTCWQKAINSTAASSATATQMSASGRVAQLQGQIASLQVTLAKLEIQTDAVAQ